MLTKAFLFGKINYEESNNREKGFECSHEKESSLLVDGALPVP